MQPRACRPDTDRSLLAHGEAFRRTECVTAWLLTATLTGCAVLLNNEVCLR